MEELGDSITEELKLLPMSAKLMTLECGVRFLTDYLDGDNYFKFHREHHNLDRARTQFKLVWDMEQKMDKMNEIIKNVLEVKFLVLNKYTTRTELARLLLFRQILQQNMICINQRQEL